METKDIKCQKCRKQITGEFCSAMDNNYHPQCFTCYRCKRRLTGTKFYLFENKPICDMDYRLTVDKCFACQRPITERSLIALGNKYHPHCFKCCVCQTPVVGQKFFTANNNQVYCLNDYGKKVAKACDHCGQPIMPEPGKTDVTCIVALNKHFHIDCYKCEDCGLLLSSDDKDRECYPVDNHVLCLKCNIKRTTK